MRDETASAAPAGANEEIFNWGAVAMHAREAEAVNVKRNPVTVSRTRILTWRGASIRRVL